MKSSCAENEFEPHAFHVIGASPQASALDRHRLGPKHHVAENGGLRRFQAVALGKMGILQSRPKASCLEAISRASSSVSAATMATWRLDGVRSLSAAGARRNSFASRGPRRPVQEKFQLCRPRPPAVSGFRAIHARAETVAENDWLRDAYRKRRCVVPINSFFQKNSSGRRYAISRRDGGPFGVAWHLGELAQSSDGDKGAQLRGPHRSGQRTGRADPRTDARDSAPRTVSTLAKRRSGSRATFWCRSRQTCSRSRLKVPGARQLQRS